MEFIAENINRIRAEIEKTGQNVTIIAVSKTHSVQYMAEAARCGLKIFGESKVQEALPKIDELKTLVPDAQWHFIGHLQSNKAARVTGNFALIHSVDSLNLAEKISKAAQALNTVQEILLEIKVSDENEKFGIAPHQAQEIFEKVSGLPFVKVRGVMAMAPYLENEKDAAPYFRKARQVFDALNSSGAGLDIMSMGMSHDFRAAIAEGSNMVRIGTAIFGNRDYAKNGG